MRTKSKTAQTNLAAGRRRAANSKKNSRRGSRSNVRIDKKRPQKATAPNATLRDNTKLAQVIALLRRKKGATIDELMEVTNWQAHSVRGTLSQVLKKKRGLTITSIRMDGIRTYRITS